MASRKKIRTRFSPSPTGYLHVGSLRTALYAYLYAKQNNGDFLLRIEDTDQSREVVGAVENLLKSLHWASLEHDEGVYLKSDGSLAEKGKFGPYTQSKRLEIYQKHAKKLITKDLAYYCFCDEDRLEKLREKQQALKLPTRYDGLCRKLSSAEAEARIANGENHVIRMKMPLARNIEFDDLVRGKVSINSNQLDDQVLLKSDGFPTYHLAVVVDDHLMEISHIIRGEEWLPSTPKHILLYEYFGWTAPAFAHLPLLLNTDKSKLSKRQGDVAVEDYRRKGYLSEAVINFVTLLGWNAGTEQEIFSLVELVKEFDLKKVHKPGAVFDLQKLNWMNGEYIKKLPPEKFIELAKPYLHANYPQLPNDINLPAIFKLEQERISHLDEIGLAVNFFFVNELSYDPKILVWKKSDNSTTVKNLKLLVADLEKVSKGEWLADKLQKYIADFIAKNELTNGEVFWPMRVALTGEEKSPPPFVVAEVLGQEKSLQRLKQGIKLLN